MEIFLWAAQHIAKEWKVIDQAPVLSAILILLGVSLGWVAVKLYYRREIGILHSTVSNWESRFRTLQEEMSLSVSTQVEVFPDSSPSARSALRKLRQDTIGEIILKGREVARQAPTVNQPFLAEPWKDRYREWAWQTILALVKLRTGNAIVKYLDEATAVQPICLGILPSVVNELLELRRRLVNLSHILDNPEAYLD